MTAEQALKLIESGFEVDEIRAFMAESGTGAEQGASGNGDQGSTGSEDQGASGSDSAQTNTINIEAIAKEIAGLKELIQAGNTRKDNGQAKLQTVDDILAKFINPQEGEEK